MVINGGNCFDCCCKCNDVCCFSGDDGFAGCINGALDGVGDGVAASDDDEDTAVDAVEDADEVVDACDTSAFDELEMDNVEEVHDASGC